MPDFSRSAPCRHAPRLCYRLISLVALERSKMSFSDFLNKIPVVGQVKGVCQYAVGDIEGGSKALSESTKSMCGVVGAVAGCAAAGPAGGVAGYVAGSAAAEAIVKITDPNTRR
ncbi:uncharacterized protein LOC106134092 [Amyelois transitella]|uniref:uncharacterized protein LOC106134092 n=1 Tax=Amyelois transitella TaxID=680683 RepID=UPI00298F8F0B|nr:uncharacterized protein LOC106134092 [Amyelois transitella]